MQSHVISVDLSKRKKILKNLSFPQIVHLRSKTIKEYNSQTKT